jgi:DNA-binding GntR family transcriptional regulator
MEFGSYANSRRVRDWCREHVAIIEAIAARDFSQASAKMRTHLEQALATAPSAQKDDAPRQVEARAKAVS